MGNRNPASALTPPPCGVRTVGLSGNDITFFFFDFKKFPQNSREIGGTKQNGKKGRSKTRVKDPWNIFTHLGFLVIKSRK